MSDYPLPSHAISVWLAGDTLWARFPPTTPGGKGHSAPFPATPEGFALALSILRERATANYTMTIGTRAAPVRYDLEKIAQALKEGTTYAKKKREKEEADEFLKEIGL